MAYALPTWKEMQEFGGVDEDAAAAAEYQHYPEPTGYITPTDEKRFLTDYVTTLPGWNDSWTQYLPAVAGFLEETITNPRDYMPAGVWDSIINWYANAGISGEGTVDMWAGANPEPTPEAGGYNWMSSNWWQPGQGIVNTYNPPQAPTVPTPTEQNDSHKQYILQDMVNQGVAGRTPGNSNLGVAPAQLEPLKATEQPMQQFSTLNQWNTMPKWDMGAGPNWSGM